MVSAALTVVMSAVNFDNFWDVLFQVPFVYVVLLTNISRASVFFGQQIYAGGFLPKVF